MYSPEQVIGEVNGRISYVLSKSARKDFITHLDALVNEHTCTDFSLDFSVFSKVISENVKRVVIVSPY